MRRLRPVESERVALSREKTARTVARRNALIATVAPLMMMSFIVVSGQYGGQDGRKDQITLVAPNAPATTGTPTDTSVLLSTSAFSGDAGDSQDSTIWRIRTQSDSTVVWADTTADSLVSWKGTGAGATVPLIGDTAYFADAQHRGSVSGLWSGYGTALDFTAALNTMGGANEPAGYSPIVGRAFNTKAADNTDRGTGSFPFKTTGSEGFDGGEWNDSNIDTVTDATDPISPSMAMEFTYPTQTIPSGQSWSPGTVVTQNFVTSANSGVDAPYSLTELYVRFNVKLSSDWANNPNSGFNKLVFFTGFDGGTKTRNGPYLKIGNAGSNFRLAWDLQGSEDHARILSPIAGTDTLKVDTWYEIEVQLVQNTAVSDSAGIVNTWIDGTLAYSDSTINLLPASDSSSTTTFFGNVEFDPIAGGQGPWTISTEFSFRLGHVWVSGVE